MSAPGVACNPILELERSKWTGRTSSGLGPSQGCKLVLLSVPFSIGSRNCASLGFAPVPDAAAIDLWLADALLIPPVAKPERAVRMAEFAGVRLAVGLGGDNVRVKD